MASKSVAAFAARTAIGPFGSRMKSDAYTDSGVPVIRGTNLTGGKVLSGEWVYVSEKTADDLSNCCVYPGDLVFPHRGAIGEIGIVPDQFPRYVMSSSLMTLSCDRSQADPDYVYYYFKSAAGRHELLKNASQVGTPGIGQPLSTLRSIQVPLPSLSSQRVISKNLGDIDLKIDLNRRINQTLEAMAQAIFKSWFVDFDPVKAKIAALAEGRDPLRAAMSAISGKSDAELDALPHEAFEQLAATAALFPDEMEESELGEIPKGWSAKPLDTVANYLNGLALQKFPPKSDSDFLPVIKIAQLRAGHVEGADRAASDLKAEYVVCDGDVLFSWSGSLEVDVWTGGKGALNQHLFKVTSSTVPKWFYLWATKYYLPEFREIAANKATTMGHIQRKHLSDARIATPSTEFINQSSTFLSPLLDEIVSLRTQSRELTKARDALLPKLISGELSVVEAIAEVEA